MTAPLLESGRIVRTATDQPEHRSSGRPIEHDDQTGVTDADELARHVG